jgi:uncharacterized protein YbbC (DUF1343 family)
MKTILLFFCFLLFFACSSSQQSTQTQVLKETIASNNLPIVVGAARFESYLSFLKNKKVAMVVNQTSMLGNTHLVDTLLRLGIQVKKIFAPEHGFRGTGDAGEKINTSIDKQTKLPLISLYGKDKKPTTAHLAGIDVVIFDIQDVGVRFYTYISTMHYVMEACAEQQKLLVILDRPNPNGDYIDGCVLEPKFQSFVGMHPIPIVHGLTVGELAEMINGEKWLANGLKCRLEVVKCLNYTHQTPYILPIKPSPNLPNANSIRLYPSLCLFEGTNISVGRGTDFPFEVIGHPDFPDKSFSFTPSSREGAKKPPFENIVCYGTDFRKGTDWQYEFSLQALIQYYGSSKDKKTFFNDFFTKLAGTEILRKQIENQLSEDEIRKTWQGNLDTYKQIRKKYLLYE